MVALPAQGEDGNQAVQTGGTPAVRMPWVRSFVVTAYEPAFRYGGAAGTTGAPGMTAYSASKAAVRNLARTWAEDLKGTGIRVNVLSPGPTETPGLVDGFHSTGHGDALIASVVAQTPLGRLGRPEEIANMALFLASDESSFMTGGEVFVDGGQGQI
jgi:NAD(P)-dependent dehydrogenase (short-subunit alcohol dehydrogenase family)